ncbi:MAG: hypothetical protein RMM08_01920 [Armatimonadota bacterium]|nr:hypothetical protein [Armatimonadota bacterium]
MRIQTLDDLIQILQEHPEWRDRLRDVLFTEEEKQVPDRLRRIEEALDRLTHSHERAIARLEHQEQSHQQALERLERLEASVERLWQSHQQALERLERLEASVERLWQSHQQALERLERLEASVERLWQSHQQALERLERLEASHQQLLEEVRELRKAVERLTAWLERLDVEVAKWRGYTLELRFHQRASAILGYYVRRPRVLDLGMVVEDLIDAGAEFSDKEKAEVLSLDELVSAKHPHTGEPIHIAVEVSWMIFPDDVERAARRATILTERGLQTFPAVAGEGITPDARDLAERKQVLVILDGAIDLSAISWVR